MNIQEAADKYLSELGARLSPNTVAAYRAVLRAFCSYVGETHRCDMLSHKTFLSFASAVLQAKYRPSTASLYAVALRAFVRFLIRIDAVSYSQADVSKVEDSLKSLQLKSGARLPRVPSLEDAAAVIKAAYDSPLPSPVKERNIALVELLDSSGCRIHEVTLLKVGDINTKKGEAIVLGKGKKERKVFLSPAAVNGLSRYWKARKDASTDAPAFARHDDGAGKKTKPVSTRTLRDAVEDLAAIAGVGGFTPHKFRHIFATRLLEETSDLAMVQDALGHQSPETTRVYAHVNPENIRRAHKQIWR